MARSYAIVVASLRGSKMTDSEILTAAHAIIAEGLIKMGRQDFCYDLCVSHRMTHKAGSCYGNIIKLSGYFFSKPENAHELRSTTLHELAHALVGTYHRHNHVWRAMAIALGDDGGRCHSMPVPTKTAWCQKCGAKYDMPIKRYARIRNHTCDYGCRKCGGYLGTKIPMITDPTTGRLIIQRGLDNPKI
jgi:predicted SprT family Zn-dependent metalloprotease